MNHYAKLSGSAEIRQANDPVLCAVKLEGVDRLTVRVSELINKLKN